MSQLAAASGGEVPSSDATSPQGFEAFPISQPVRDAIAAMGYQKPLEVQAAVIGPALAGRDLVVQSKTGSGKTAAFGIPIIEKVAANSSKPGLPLSLVLAPTRELALQVADEVRAIGSKKGVKVVAIYGGVPMGRQVAGLKGGAEVVAGTPGRLLDHVRRGTLSFNDLKVVVLDEADEMLSMGFWEEVTEILSKTPENRQTMLFSATLPYEVARAAAQYLKDPVRLDLSGDELTVAGIENCIYHVVADIPKPRQLLYVLEYERPTSAIIFCNTRNEAEMIAKFLTQSGFVAEALTGNFRQKERERVMERIKSGDLKYMVATDVAARGIDINDLSHVLNYSLPEFSEVYLHRVGRTGRIGKAGAAVSLVDGKGLGTLSVLEREFSVHFTERILPPEAEALRFRSQRIMKELSEKASVAEVGQHLNVAQDIIAGSDGAQIVAFLLKSYFNNRAADIDRRPPLPSQNGRPPQPSQQAQHDGQPGEMGMEGGSRRRGRRRRRRGRGRGGAEGGYGEVVDAHEILQGDSGSAFAPPPLREPSAAPMETASLSTPSAVVAAGNGNGNGSSDVAAPAAGAEVVLAADGMTRLRVNIGFDDGFKGRGAVAKKIAALAGLNDGIVHEVESRRDYAVIKATPDIAELVIERVDGAQLGKKILTVAVAGQ
ncbi:MAG: DEAD/DEAH box helicase [Deltaproteobacteria bacterium]|nr:DEAD/DEAH box helicase [Deltaproteobacteria bacterium]